MRRHHGEEGFVEGVVFTHPDGRFAKLRRDMFSWYKEERHNVGKKRTIDNRKSNYVQSYGWKLFRGTNASQVFQQNLQATLL